MAEQPEVKVKKGIKKALMDIDAWYCMPMGTGYGNSGVPDFICCIQGTFVAIEAKAGKNTTTALQDREIRRINEAGGIALVVYEDGLDTLAKDLTALVRGRG